MQVFRKIFNSLITIFISISFSFYPSYIFAQEDVISITPAKRIRTLQQIKNAEIPKEKKLKIEELIEKKIDRLREVFEQEEEAKREEKRGRRRPKKISEERERLKAERKAAKEEVLERKRAALEEKERQKAERKAALEEKKLQREAELALKKQELEEARQKREAERQAAIEEEKKQEALEEQRLEEARKEREAEKQAALEEERVKEETEVLEEEKPVFVSEEEAEQYRINPHDIIDISVYEEPNLSNSFRVTMNGRIKYPLLGEIELKGLTLKEAAAKLESALGESYLVNPQVTIFVEEYVKFNVLGEVKKQGSYELKGSVTVVDAIALAGGFTDIANTNRVRVVRGKDKKVITVPVGSILRGRTGKGKNILIEENDTIIVPKGLF